MTFTDAKQRFSNRVADYIRYRPGYPTGALALLRSECDLRPGHVIAITEKLENSKGRLKSGKKTEKRRCARPWFWNIVYQHE